MTSYFKNIFLVAVFIIFSHGLPAYANNISVSNAGLGAQDTGGQTMEIQFDITWEHSWSDAINSDAAWVFVKYSTDGGVTWTLAQRLGSETDVQSLAYLGSNFCLAGTGPTGQIYRSTDSGVDMPCMEV